MEELNRERFDNLILAWEALCRSEDWDSVVEVQRDLILDFNLSMDNFDYVNCKVVEAAAAPTAAQTALVAATAPVPVQPTAALPPPVAVGAVPLAKAPPGTPSRVPVSMQGMRPQMGRISFW